MDVNQVVTKAQEQLWLVMEAQHQETTLQLWAEKAVETWVGELCSVVASDKAAVEEASERAVERFSEKKGVEKVAGEAAEELQIRQIQVSSGSLQKFWKLTCLF